MGLLERELGEAIDAAVDGDGRRPQRVHALFEDYPPAPALYAEFDVDDARELTGEEPDAEEVAVIVHNFRYYPLGMERWDVGVVELLVLNELHELTHWAMTGGERAYFDDRSRRHHRGDGYWLNPPLLEIIDWLPREHPDVVEDEPPVTALGRLRRRIGGWLRRQRARLGLYQTRDPEPAEDEAEARQHEGTAGRDDRRERVDPVAGGDEGGGVGDDPDRDSGEETGQ